MISFFDDPTIVENEDIVGIHDGLQTVGNDQDCFILHQLVDGFLNKHFIFRIKTCCRFIQKYDRRVGKDRSCNRDPLLLSSRKSGTAFTYHRVIAVRKRKDKVMTGSGRPRS